METVFAFFMTLLLAASTLYLLVAFVIIPIIKIYQEKARLKH